MVAFQAVVVGVSWAPASLILVHVGCDGGVVTELVDSVRVVVQDVQATIAVALSSAMPLAIYTLCSLLEVAVRAVLDGVVDGADSSSVGGRRPPTCRERGKSGST